MVWEITILESEMEMGTFDYDVEPAIGVVYEGDMRVVALVEMDAVARTATVAIEFV